MFLKQRTTYVAVQVIGEVINKKLKPSFQNLGLVTDEQKAKYSL